MIHIFISNSLVLYLSILFFCVMYGNFLISRGLLSRETGYKKSFFHLHFIYLFFWCMISILFNIIFYYFMDKLILLHNFNYYCFQVYLLIFCYYNHNFLSLYQHCIQCSTVPLFFFLIQPKYTTVIILVL